MGALGPGSFDNDAAQDWLAELEADGPPAIQAALRAAANARSDEYIDVNQASAALAAAELVAAARGGPSGRLDPRADAWLRKHRSAVAKMPLAIARRAVARVFARTELRDLWDENGPDTEWHRGVRELLVSLGGRQV